MKDLIIFIIEDLKKNLTAKKVVKLLIFLLIGYFVARLSNSDYSFSNFFKFIGWWAVMVLVYKIIFEEPKQVT